MPSPFDMVLTPEQVLSVAAPFISGGCGPAAALGLIRRSLAHRIRPAERSATPALSLTNTDPVGPGTLLTFGGSGLEGKDPAVSVYRHAPAISLKCQGLFCNMIVGGAAEALSFPLSECKVPDDLDGPGQFQA